MLSTFSKSFAIAAIASFTDQPSSMRKKLSSCMNFLLESLTIKIENVLEHASLVRLTIITDTGDETLTKVHRRQLKLATAGVPFCHMS